MWHAPGHTGIHEISHQQEQNSPPANLIRTQKDRDKVSPWTLRKMLQVPFRLLGPSPRVSRRLGLHTHTCSEAHASSYVKYPARKELLIMRNVRAL